VPNGGGLDDFLRLQWARQDSNLGPTDYEKAAAVSAWLVVAGNSLHGVVLEVSRRQFSSARLGRSDCHFCCPLYAAYPMAFEPDVDVSASVHDLYWNELAPITVSDGFTAWFTERFESRAPLEERRMPHLVRAFVDAQTDLHRLLEEIRFEAAFAYLLIADYRAKRKRGEAPALEPSPLPAGVLDAEVAAVMSRYMREPPSPDEFLRDPYVEFSGHRIVSDWFAGQLLDSALVREVAASDRLATLLWTRAGLPLHVTRRGRERRPTFTPDDLSALNGAYGDRPEWRELRDLATNPLFAFAKGLRDDFTHARRLVSELHGEEYRSYGDEPGVAGVDAGDHLAIVLAIYDAVLRPAVRLTGELLARRPPQPSPARAEPPGSIG
jgi:hypothetical protein